ncbi:MCE family protein [Kutzneria viridogrisea]|uniref:ABC transporter substrate-binding protein n=2 Tax=Kutzneria TaxID=43356 RepID=W5WNE3_9PSEU|nr:MCE family protein [Kutzneria albida]AHH99669.1 hypothetical protein KALB_6309 [Kutzneria albida DSM 43870]MBA8924845.1 virulence factor Mce-like protein [Kutzneria viridogrisea]
MGKRLAALAAVLLVAVSGSLWWIFSGPGATALTAFFDEAVGVFPGSDVRVLGVKVGTVDTVRPVGKQVQVTMTLDPDIAVPAEARAVVLAPSLVADRYVQLAPAYTSGPKLPSGSTITMDRTATPVELDQLYSSLNQLATALGPNGANSGGALSGLIDTGSALLKGNGQQLNDTIKQLGDATRTLSGSKDDLFGTVDNIQKFTTMLAQNDNQVHEVTQKLSSVAGFLAQDKDDLGAALNSLADALAKVRQFIQDNRSRITSNVNKLADISKVLAKQRDSLAEALDVAPLALQNVLNAYDPKTGTLNGRGNLNEFRTGNGPVLPFGAGR